MSSSQDQAKRRGLGPFTGGQLTAMIIAGVVAIGFPVGAFAAVSGSNAFITDHTSGVHASVTSQGSLQVATIPQEGSVDLIGEALGGAGENNSCGFYRVPTNDDLVITSVQFNSGVGTTGTGTSGTDQALYLDEDKSTGCASVSRTITGGIWTTSSPQQVVLDPGYVVAQKTSLDLKIINGSSNDYSLAFIYGYVIPAAQCKSLSAAAAAAGRPRDVASFVHDHAG